MKWLAGILVKQLLQVIWKAVSEYLEKKSHEKKVKEKVKQIMKEESDAEARARRISDLLNS